MSEGDKHFATIVSQFADGEYLFCLTMDKAREFETKFDKSLARTMRNMITGDWLVSDVAEIVRLALIGGGSTPSEAYRLIRTYVELRPINENTALCIKILDAFFFGPEKPAEKADLLGLAE